MKKYLALAAVLASLATPAKAIEALYLGGAIGSVAFTGTTPSLGTSIGFGADLGLRVNSVLDLGFHFGGSSHSGTPGLTLLSQTVSADFRLGVWNDIEFSLGVGPGFYFFKTPAVTNTNFGVNFGAGADVRLDDHIRLGLGGRYHVIVNPSGGDNYWTVMMRAGYLFDIGS